MLEGARTVSPSYSRRIWQSPDGLPEDFAQAVAQTADGHLWIGTSGGLVRFDGVRFTVFNSANEPAFKSDSVYSLVTTRDGALWAGTEGAGLVRYRDGSFRIFGPGDGLTNLFVRALFEDRDGRLWVGTDDGLFRLEGASFRRIDGQHGVPSMNVHAICQDRGGRILVGGGGLLVLDGDRVEHHRSAESFADNSIRTLRESRDGSLWIGTISGLRRLDGGVRGNPFLAPRIVDGTNISALYESPSGQMWIATYGRGLMRVDASGVATLRAPASLPHDNVLAVFEDARRERLGRHARRPASAAPERGRHDHRGRGRAAEHQHDLRGSERLAAGGGVERTAVRGRTANARADAAPGRASRRCRSAMSFATARAVCGSAPTAEALPASTASPSSATR